MQLFRPVFLTCLVLFGGASVLIGAVMSFSALSSGMVIISYTADGKAVAETVLRSADSDRFWRYVGFIGVLPLVLGAATTWFGLRKLRGG